MAALNNQPFMGMRNYSMPPALSGYDFTPAQLHAILTEPAVNMHYNENGDLVPAGTASINADQGDIVSNGTAALPTHGETLNNRRSGIMMNQDPARYAPDGSYLVGNPYATDEGALASANTGPGPSGSNRLTNLLSGLSRDAIGFAKDVKANGISVTYDGNEIFATDGENTVPVTKETAEAIEAASNGGVEQAPSQQSGPMGMSFNPPVPALAAPNESGTVVTDNTGPVLRQPTSNTARNGNAARRMTGGYTGNARGSNLPDMQIGLGERLMRMGAAGMAAGGQGGLAQLGAMFGASADVNQANRQGAMDTFKIEEERRQAHAARVASLAASGSKGAGGGGDLSFDTANQINNMQMALEALKSGALTGVWDAGVKGWMDKYGMTDDFNELTGFLFGGEKGIGARRAHIRNILQNIKVNDALAIAAKTKGAISDTEMKLFLSPFPTQFQDEGVWIEMLESKLRILQKIQGYSGSGSQPSKEPLFTAADGVKVFAE